MILANSVLEHGPSPVAIQASLPGFEPRFIDLPDYILKITEEIWERRQTSAIADYYHTDCLVHTGMGDARGMAGVVVGTIEKMSQFPDREIMAEDVIWSGDAKGGFLSSHRSMMSQTHLGEGVLGPPTGRRLYFRAIADCACINNQIYEEWLIVDQTAAARQAGIEPRALAAALAAADHAAGRPAPALTFSDDRPGPDTRLIQDDAAAALVRDGYEAIWGERRLDGLDRFYARGVNLCLPGGEGGFGRTALAAFITGYLASFPDARFTVEHSIALREPERPVRVATRWTLAGTHAGHGRFGPPSGAPMFVMGITHAELADGRITREWTMIDELAVWRRIARHELARANS